MVTRIRDINVALRVNCETSRRIQLSSRCRTAIAREARRACSSNYGHQTRWINAHHAVQREV